MSTHSQANKQLARYIIDQLEGGAPISTRAMFGAMAIYRSGLVFAMTWKGSLYFKVDETTRTYYETAGSHALDYVSQGEHQSLKSFWEVPADVIEDEARLREWADKAYRAAVESADR